MPSHRADCPSVFAIMALALGCYSVPSGRQAVSSVDIDGTSALSSGRVKEKIATAPSPKFLGLWRGLFFDYTYYDQSVVQRDAARIERFYQAKGYYDVRVRAVRVIPKDQELVRVQFVVEEGSPVLVQSARLEGLEGLAFEDMGVAAAAVQFRPGDRWDEDEHEDTKRRIVAELSERGYAWAEVEGRVEINVLTRQANAVYVVNSGPKFKLGTITVTGLGKSLPEAPVRRALDLRPNQDFSTSDLESAKIALVDLGVFSSVDITWTQRPRAESAAPPLRKGPDGTPLMDIEVHVEPTLLHVVKGGVGGEFDVIRTDVHGVVGWEALNFLGGLRKLSLTAKPGLVLYPNIFQNFKKPSDFLPELRVFAELRQPGFLEARTSAVVRGEFSIYPVLLPVNDTDSNSEQVILGYRELKGSVGLERSLFGNHLFLGTFFHFQRHDPFAYVGDTLLDDVQLRYVELQANINFRDDAIHPHKGAFLGTNLQLADFWGDIKDIKVQPDLRVYVPISQSVTFALRGSVGFLFPGGYYPAKDPTDQNQENRALQLLYFRGFFSGGSSSNRGYPFRGVGPHGVAGFFYPSFQEAQRFIDACNSTSPDPQVQAEKKAACNSALTVPLGGLSLWEASAEVRFPLLGALTGAVFLDSSDVSKEIATLQFRAPHLSAGGGLRYDTPVGPIRFDLGYRIPGLQKIGGKLDPSVDGNPGTLLGAPVAFSLGIGEVF